MMSHLEEENDLFITPPMTLNPIRDDGESTDRRRRRAYSDRFVRPRISNGELDPPRAESQQDHGSAADRHTVRRRDEEDEAASLRSVPLILSPGTVDESMGRRRRRMDSTSTGGRTVRRRLWPIEYTRQWIPNDENATSDPPRVVDSPRVADPPRVPGPDESQNGPPCHHTESHETRIDIGESSGRRRPRAETQDTTSQSMQRCLSAAECTRQGIRIVEDASMVPATEDLQHGNPADPAVPQQQVAASCFVWSPPVPDSDPDWETVWSSTDEEDDGTDGTFPPVLSPNHEADFEADVRVVAGEDDETNDLIPEVAADSFGSPPVVTESDWDYARNWIDDTILPLSSPNYEADELENTDAAYHNMPQHPTTEADFEAEVVAGEDDETDGEDDETDDVMHQVSSPVFIYERADHPLPQRQDADPWSNMRMNVEHMSYEELIALGDTIGRVSTGLSLHDALTHIHEDFYTPAHDQPSCVLCLEDYVEKVRLGFLSCIHYFHHKCLVDWLQHENKCPICKQRSEPK